MMERETIIYSKGKLQVACNIITELKTLFKDLDSVCRNLDESFFALNRADAAMDSNLHAPFKSAAESRVTVLKTPSHKTLTGN